MTGASPRQRASQDDASPRGPQTHRVPFPGASAPVRWLHALLALAIGLPLLLPWLFHLIVIRKRRVGRIAERFGGFRLRASESTSRIWVHAVSVGEYQAARALVRKLSERGHDVVVSTMTTTARELAVSDLGADRVFLFPIDVPFAIGRTFRRVRPSLLVLVELELWPGVLLRAKRDGVPVAIVNGRISERGARRASRVRPVYRWMLGLCDRFLVQDEIYAERFRSLGAPESAIEIVGNLKFDLQVASPDDRAATRRALDALFGVENHSPIVVAGSTHEADEHVVAVAFEELQRRNRGVRLVIAPRHVERAPAVAEMFRSAGHRVAIGDPLAPTEPRAEDALPTDVHVVDCVGRLTALYAGADVAFVGGGFDRTEGHNILEPVAAGTPTTHGPRMKNFRREVEEFTARELAVEVDSATQLAEQLWTWIADPRGAAELSDRARDALEAHRGALGRTVPLLETHLPAPPA